MDHQESSDLRNFLFFLNGVHSQSIEDALIGILARPSSKESVADMIGKARRDDPFAGSVNGLQLYVHVPYCAKICTFCHCRRDLLKQKSELDEFIVSLKKQMKYFSGPYKGMNASSLAFGGGTPSILNEQQLTEVIDEADRSYPHKGRKIYFEVSPSSWSATKLKILNDRGLFRLSIGLQTFDGGVLKTVNRPQTRKQALWCLSSARKAGIPHVNVDFIAGLPGQTVDGLIKDVKLAIDEGANAVHVHALTRASVKDMCSPGETIPEYFKRRHAMMKQAREIIKDAGFTSEGLNPYKKSEGDEEYLADPYLRLQSAVAGFGPFAAGQFPGAVFYKLNPKESLSAEPSVSACEQDADYVMARYAMYAVIHGLSEEVFQERFGVPFNAQIKQGLKYLEKNGLIGLKNGSWKFTGKWELKRVTDLVTLSKVLFGKKILTRLRSQFMKEYDAQYDYGANFNPLLHNWCMIVYYRMGI